MNTQYEGHGVPGAHVGIVIHDFYPYDCYKQLTDNEALSFHLESPDDQCAFRSLCGACQENFKSSFNFRFKVLIAGVLLVGIVVCVFVRSSIGIKESHHSMNLTQKTEMRNL